MRFSCWRYFAHCVQTIPLMSTELKERWKKTHRLWDKKCLSFLVEKKWCAIVADWFSCMVNELGELARGCVICLGCIRAGSCPSFPVHHQLFCPKNIMIRGQPYLSARPGDWYLKFNVGSQKGGGAFVLRKYKKKFCKLQPNLVFWFL